MNIFVYNHFPLNENCRIFFTLQNFSSISSRLSHNFRPIWVTKPSTEFVYALFNESIKLLESQSSRRISEAESLNSNFKMIDFVYWNRETKEVPMILTNSMWIQDLKLTKSPVLHQNTFFNTLLNNKFLLKSDFGFKQQDDVNWILENCYFSVFYMRKNEFF